MALLCRNFCKRNSRFFLMDILAVVLLLVYTANALIFDQSCFQKGRQFGSSPADPLDNS